MILFNKILLILHFLGLAMGLSVGFANMTMAALINKAAPPEKPILGRFPLAMVRVGNIGLTILIVTGLTMVFTRYRGFATLPATFHVKLTAVGLLAIVVGYINYLRMKILKGDTAALARVQVAGKMASLLALIAVIFAVLTFN
ncbi:MAG TPA: hypothetical protein VF247_12630 [Candidatus Krumholzibacteria bacterium]